MREFQLEEKVKKKINMNQHFFNIILELLND